MECSRSINSSQPIYRRNWKSYEKDKLISLLEDVDWNSDDDTVQGYWNTFENKLINVVDVIAPMRVESSNISSGILPKNIKTAINRRKNLLRKWKTNKNCEIKKEIVVLNKLIRRFFFNTKAERIRKIILPGNSESLWKAVKAAKDINVNSLPKRMFENNYEIEEDSLQQRFASFFDQKIKKILDDVKISPMVYNGINKITNGNRFFMQLESVKSSMLSLKPKNSEGFDRIPQRILKDGADVLSIPMFRLMDLIYHEKRVPDQWLVAKTIPVFKNKGNKKDIENYRSIDNLCSS